MVQGRRKGQDSNSRRGAQANLRGDSERRATVGLTVLKVASLRAPGRYGDGHGLYLQVSKWGTKSWLFRFRRGGRSRQMGLGPVHTVGLADARERALKCRRLLLDGIDPINARVAERHKALLESASAATFRQCAERYIAAHAPAWRNAVHRRQWDSTLEKYAYPVIGNLSIATVDVGLVLKVIEPIWTVKVETASRVRGRIELIVDWATARGLRQGENPARWRGHLDKLLPSRRRIARIKHHAAMPYPEIPSFMTQLAEIDGTAARAFEFTVLTAARTSETIGATWAEIDMRGLTWNIPAERMKSGRPHRVPLADAAIKILEAQGRDGEFVFPGRAEKKPLCNMSLAKLLKRIGRSGITVHGCRSSFRDWCAETTAYPNRLRRWRLPTSSATRRRPLIAAAIFSRSGAD